jgi:alpha-ketoglutarate-dependent taurine dioxygenase
MSSRELRITEVAPNIGAIIAGINLSQGVDQQTFNQIRGALLKHRVIFLKINI